MLPFINIINSFIFICNFPVIYVMFLRAIVYLGFYISVEFKLIFMTLEFKIIHWTVWYTGIQNWSKILATFHEIFPNLKKNNFYLGKG